MKPTRQRRRLNVAGITLTFAALAFAATLACMLLYVWTGDGRWFATGWILLFLAVVLAVASATTWQEKP